MRSAARSKLARNAKKKRPNVERNAKSPKQMARPMRPTAFPTKPIALEMKPRAVRTSQEPATRSRQHHHWSNKVCDQVDRK